VLGVLLALGSSMVWGLSDFVGGLQSRRHPLLAVLLWAQVTATVLAGSYVLLAGDPVPGGTGLAWAIAGGALGTAGLAAFYRGLAIGSMSIVAPVAATGAAVPVLFGVIGGERPGAVQVAGILVAMVGVVLASREAGAERGDGEGPARDGIDRAVSRAALGLALIAAVGFGGFFVALQRATEAGGVGWSLLIVRSVQVVLLLAAAAVVRPKLSMGPRAMAPIIGVGVGDLTANAMFAVATTMGLLSVVAVLGSLYPAMTVVLARTVLDERVSGVQMAGVGAVLAGIVAISAG
jgi:drug/metabolite transporter (DMT)-like permease